MARPADPTAHASLLAAGVAEFAKHGLVKARIEDITAACGLSKGAFYLHFESKEALFAEASGSMMQVMNSLMDERREAQESLLASVSPKRGVTEAQRQAFTDLDTVYDRRTLEAMWEHRQVIDVMLRGATGTSFESMLWTFVDAEMKRIAVEIERTAALGLCRTDVPAEVIGAMVMGTWLMLARRMSAHAQKPDLAFWVESLKQLLLEGIVVKPVAQSTAKKTKRKTNARSVT
jgi:AcrR family transcriptional regulator